MGIPTPLYLLWKSMKVLKERQAYYSIWELVRLRLIFKWQRLAMDARS